MKLQAGGRVSGSVGHHYGSPGVGRLPNNEVRQSGIGNVEECTGFGLNELGTQSAAAHEEQEVVRPRTELDGEVDVTGLIGIAASGFAVDVNHQVPRGFEHRD